MLGLPPTRAAVEIYQQLPAINKQSYINTSKTGALNKEKNKKSPQRVSIST